MQYEELDIPRFGPRAAPVPSYRMRRRRSDGTQRMMILAGGCGVAIMLFIGAWSMIGRSHGPVPVIQADSRPFRVKPEVRGGLQLSGVNDDSLSGEVGKQTDALGAPTELPQTEQLRQMQQAELERGQAPSLAPPPAESVPEEPRTALPTIANPAPEVKPAPAAKSAVQLAIVGSEPAARHFWQLMATRMPELLAGKKPVLTHTTRDGRPIWHVRIEGFATETTAAAFCEQVHAKGGGCSVAGS